jgi:GNAT superfamily N-acetyltransferase
LVEWDDPVRFYTSHINPNTEVGRRFRDNQSFSRPRVAVAIDRGEMIGFGYSAHNVSGGSAAERLLKRLTLKKNYLWLREIAVEPASQGRGIAKHLGAALLKDALPLQPVATYVWPEEGVVGFMQTLERLGFHVTGTEFVRIFGKANEPVRQARMEAQSARKVLAKLIHPDF